MLRLITASDSTSISAHSIKSLCRGKSVAPLESETDIRAEIEKGFIQQQSPSNENNMIEFGDEDDRGAFLDMFGFDDDADDGDGFDDDDYCFRKIRTTRERTQMILKLEISLPRKIIHLVPEK